MARIFWVSDSPFNVTGYATISTNICNGLVDNGHEVFYLGHNFIGQDIPPGVKFADGKELKFTVLGGSGREPYAKDLWIPKIRELKPDFFGILLDTFMLYPHYLQMDYAPAKTIFYFPSDGGGGMPLGCENILRKANIPIAMAKFGQKQVKDLYGINTEYIPHAVDTKIYYPLPEKERNELRVKWGLQDKFVVGSVYRNQGRKMPDRMFKAFALFAKKCPNAVLFCHSDPLDGAAVFDSFSLIRRYGIENRVIFSGMKYYRGFDYKKMNEVYNLMDVFFLSTSGEGFGVPIIEAQACGIPVLVTNYTTTSELVIKPKSGFGIDLVGTSEEENPEVHENELLDGTLCGSWNVERGICSIKDAAKKLEILYNDLNLRKEMGQNGIKNVNENYNWDKVNKMWDELIKENMK